MNTFSVEKYQPKFESIWNDFVTTSKNATFLFHRDFMEYHQDRFEDFSLLVFKNEKLIALLPANSVGNDIHSHQGLTYGGLLLNKAIKFGDVLNSFQAVLQFLNDRSIQHIHLKLLPKIYHSVPSDELDYLMFLLNADIQKKEILSVIDLNRKLKIASNRLEGVKRGIKNELKIKEETSFDQFWNTILSVNLKEKHGVNPVHSLEEIEKLRIIFPKQIRQFNVYDKDKLVAGTTIFETKQVAHCQYISANKEKNTLGSLDFLHHHLITNVFKDKSYYDFGSSNEDSGRKINEGLQYWKEGFGARTIIHDFYTVKTENANLLNSVFK